MTYTFDHFMNEVHLWIKTYGVLLQLYSADQTLLLLLKTILLTLVLAIPTITTSSLALSLQHHGIPLHTENTIHALHFHPTPFSATKYSGFLTFSVLIKSLT